MSKRSTTEQFKEKANKVKNFEYDYSKVIYVDNRTKVEILCKTHGSFFQAPDQHLGGSGCPKCNGGVKLNTEEFIQRSICKFGAEYGLCKVVYKNNHTKIELICQEHGSFWQTPNAHLAGQKCPKCTGNIRLSNDQFIDRSNVIHNFFYNYSKVVYVNSNTKVIIICPTHGEFEQTPDNHLGGHGCPKCSSSVSKKESSWFESINNPNIVKQFRIKTEDRHYVVDGYDPTTNTVYEFYGDFWHGNPKLFDENAMNVRSNTTYGQLYSNTIKRENELKACGYQIITIWESDFDKEKRHGSDTVPLIG